MKIIAYIIATAVIILAGIIGYVRLAPVDPASYAAVSSPRPTGEYSGLNSFAAVRQITAPPEDILRVIETIAQATPRTTVDEKGENGDYLAFVTRSAFFGFPDITAVSIIPPGAVDNAGPLLMMDARSVYGTGDLGVNEARVNDWLNALGPLTVAP